MIKGTTELLEVVVTGDTTMKGLLENPLCFEAHVLVMECTYAGNETTVEATQARGHIHFDEIVENAGLFKNKAIILMV